MGGYGSGRYGGRPTTTDGLTLNFAKLLRDRYLRPGQDSGGSLVWTNTRTGKQVGSIGYQASLGDEAGRLRLSYTITDGSGEKHASDGWVELTTLPQPFGGRRWWFICPLTGRRVANLYLPPGALLFASRHAYRLGYRSQRETQQDRALSRAFKLRHRIGAQGGIGDHVPRPKGMRRVTYDKHLRRIWRAEDIVDAHGEILLSKLKGVEGWTTDQRR
ncbi:hypothetical protein [Methylorubrum extorquens]